MRPTTQASLKILTPSFWHSRLAAMMKEMGVVKRSVNLESTKISPRLNSLEKKEVLEVDSIEEIAVVIAVAMRVKEGEEEKMPQSQTTCFLTKISQPCEQESWSMTLKIEEENCYKVLKDINE